MDAIIDKEILTKKSEDKTVRPLEMQGRIALFVYCNSYKGNRQLVTMGILVIQAAKHIIACFM